MQTINIEKEKAVMDGFEKKGANRMGKFMYEGDLIVNKLKDKGKVIIILGNLKSCKTSLYNYMMGLQVKQQKTRKENRKSKVVSRVQRNQNSKFKSQYCAPNVGEVQVNNQKVSLCDAPGFNEESGSYDQTLGELYVLEKIFQSTKEVGIILTITHNKFEDDEVSERIRPFARFINILNTQSSELQAFFKCVSVVVTKAQWQKQDYLYDLSYIISFLQSEKQNKTISIERSLILQLLTGICQSKKLQIFKKLVNGVVDPQKSQILNNLTHKDTNWQFNKYQQKNWKCILKIPYVNKSQKMQKENKEKYNEEMKNKLQFIRTSLKLIQKFVKKATDHWNQKYINYHQQYQQLEELIKQHPYGNDINEMIKYLKIDLQKYDDKPIDIIKMNLLNQLLNIQKGEQEMRKQCMDQTKKDEQKITMLMSSDHKLYCNFLDICRKTFSRTKSQQQSFIKLMLINQRNLQQCLIHCKIDQSDCSRIIMDIRYFSFIGELNQKFFQEFQKQKKNFQSTNLKLKNYVQKINNILQDRNKKFQKMTTFVQYLKNKQKYSKTNLQQQVNDRNQQYQPQQLNYYKQANLFAEGLQMKWILDSPQLFHEN